MRKAIEYLLIAVGLIAGNVLISILVLPIIAILLFFVFWLISENFINMGPLTILLDILALIACFALYSSEKVKLSFREFKKQFLGNM